MDLDQEDSLGLHQFDDNVTSPRKSSDAEELRLRLEMQVSVAYCLCSLCLKCDNVQLRTILKCSCRDTEAH